MSASLRWLRQRYDDIAADAGELSAQLDALKPRVYRVWDNAEALDELRGGGRELLV